MVGGSITVFHDDRVDRRTAGSPRLQTANATGVRSFLLEKQLGALTHSVPARQFGKAPEEPWQLQSETNAIVQHKRCATLFLPIALKLNSRRSPSHTFAVNRHERQVCRRQSAPHTTDRLFLT